MQPVKNIAAATTTLSLLPRHIAIVMDGNGRWAKARNLPRVAGHKAGVESVRAIIRACAEKKIEVLTLWAFSTENWQRPVDEVEFIMGLALRMLTKEVRDLHANNIQLRVVGERERLNPALRQAINNAEMLTMGNTGLKLVIALSYGGRWDITQAVRKISEKVAADELCAADITEEVIASHLALAGLPDVDLFIRPSGEMRISNFLLWQSAYAEFYFTDVMWPDFRAAELEAALADYAARERRFGKISEQLLPGGV